MEPDEQASTDTKVVVITGASRGIGRALAAATAQAGYRVVVNYRSDPTQAEAFIIELARDGCKAYAVRADVGIAGDVAALIKATIERFGRIDCVVNNAGIGEPIALKALDEETFTRTLHANLTSAFLVSQAAWPHMRRGAGGWSSCRQSQRAPAARSQPPTPPRKAASRH